MQKFLLLTILLISACTSRPTLDHLRYMEVWPDEAARYFRPGELIRVYTFDGTIYEFKLVDITATAIVGKRQQIPFDDIAKLERRF